LIPDESTIDRGARAAHAALVLRSRTIGLCLALTLAGCGAQEPTPSTPAPAVQPAQAITSTTVLGVNARTERSLNRATGYCAAKVAGRDPSPSADRIQEKVADLVTLERTDPETQVRVGGKSLNDAIARVAATLRPCDPALANELVRTAAAIPEL
jgi:hypothetical protein